MRYVMDDKRERRQEFQQIAQQREQLEIERHNLAQVMQSIDQKNNDLKAREAKIKDIEPLLPSVREFQRLGLTYDLLIPYWMTLQEKSASENLDIKTAAYNLGRDFRDYSMVRSLGDAIQKAEQKLMALDELNMQKETAIITLVNLQLAGFTETDIMGMWKGGIGLGAPGINQGNGHDGMAKRLDTKLIGTGN
jgi:hypothetical protein